MTKPAALLAGLAASVLAPAAWADQPTTTTAGTVVVVTPQAPVVVPAQQPVLAPPGAAEEPPPARAVPQNESWDNVSHINGTPVPVGERNRYLYNYRRTNLSVNPFGVFFGYYDVGVAHGVSQNVALAGSLSGFGQELNAGYQATVSAPIYFRRTFSGPFLEPGLMVRDIEEHIAVDCVNAACPQNDSKRWFGVEMLFGWQWIFDSGLNVELAFGVARHLASNQMNESDGADANGYFRVGYAF